MRRRIACVILALSVMLSGINCDVVFAQELPQQEMNEQELPEQELPEQELPEQELPEEELTEQEMPEEELPKQELPEESPEQDMAVEQLPVEQQMAPVAKTEEPVSEEEEPVQPDVNTEVEIDYSIKFKNLRGKNSTWIFSDEKEYRLALNTVNLKECENVDIRWNVTVKETGNVLKAGYKVTEDKTAIIMNGDTLKRKGFTNKTLIVKAVVWAEGEKTEFECQTEVLIKNKKITLNTVLKDTHEIGEKWNYFKKLNVYIEDSNYPKGKNVYLQVKEAVSSNTSILEVAYNNEKEKWTAKAKKTGTAKVTFSLSDGKNTYKVEKKTKIVCYHERTYKVVQLENLLAQAKKWLGYKESDGSHMKIVNTYNAYSPLPINYTVQKWDAWCATYVSAVAIKKDYTHLIPVECGCERMIERFKERGNWKENENCTPETGWIIFYDWQDNGRGDNKGWSDHVGIVEKVVDGTITVIEGNYDDKVKRRTIAVNGQYIRGYGVPEYGKETVRATTSKKGSIKEGCTVCGDVKETSIYPATKISLKRKDFTYNGKPKELSVSVKNSKGNTVDSGEYYLSGSVSKASIGKYSVKVYLDGKKYKGTKTLYYTIHPKAPAKVRAFLYNGHDDVKVSWEESTGADGYFVYYKKGTDKEYSKLLSTTKTYFTKKNLQDGKRYYFKIVPYFVDGSKKVESINSKTANVYTLKKLKTPVISKKNKNTVKVTWEDISGETGYQISKSIRNGDTIVCETTSKNTIDLKVTRRLKYHYKVRAYKKINGEMIYGPWSDVVSYKLK